MDNVFCMEAYKEVKLSEEEILKRIDNAYKQINYNVNLSVSYGIMLSVCENPEDAEKLKIKKQSIREKNINLRELIQDLRGSLWILLVK